MVRVPVRRGMAEPDPVSCALISALVSVRVATRADGMDVTALGVMMRLPPAC